MSVVAAKNRLMSEYKGLTKEKWVNIEVSHIRAFWILAVETDLSSQMDEETLFKWNIGLLVVNDESAFNGAYLKVWFAFWVTLFAAANS